MEYRITIDGDAARDKFIVSISKSGIVRLADQRTMRILDRVEYDTMDKNKDYMARKIMEVSEAAKQTPVIILANGPLFSFAYNSEESDFSAEQAVRTMLASMPTDVTDEVMKKWATAERRRKEEERTRQGIINAEDESNLYGFSNAAPIW